MNWLDMESDRDNNRFAADQNCGRYDDVEAGTFWSERYKAAKGNHIASLQIALNNLPAPGAFSKAALSLRAMIREARKNKLPYEDFVKDLYELAAIFSMYIPYSKAIRQPGYNVMESMPGGMIRKLPYDYAHLGYQELTLLSKTDIKWIVELWGEPNQHTTLHTLYHHIWRKYEVELPDKQNAALERQTGRAFKIFQVYE